MMHTLDSTENIVNNDKFFTFRYAGPFFPPPAQRLLHPLLLPALARQADRRQRSAVPRWIKRR